MNNTIHADINAFNYSALPENTFLCRRIESKNIDIPAIVSVDVLGYSMLSALNKIYFQNLFLECMVFPIHEKEILNAIKLKQHNSMPPDDIIAATTLSQNIPLFTANTKGFKHIDSPNSMGLDEIKAEWNDQEII